MITEEILDLFGARLVERLDRVFTKDWLPGEPRRTPEGGKSGGGEVRLEVLPSRGKPLVVGDWVAEAACRQHPELDFFNAEDGTNHYWSKKMKEAEIKVCGSCPVRVDCLDHAIEYDEPFGIWGGLLPWERRRRK